MKWISVDKRKPKVGQEVLCYCEFEYYCVGKIAQIVFTQCSPDVKSVSFLWKDNHGDSIDPEYWIPITPPNKE